MKTAEDAKDAKQHISVYLGLWREVSGRFYPVSLNLPFSASFVVFISIVR
jgi:hypothetical protein